VEHSRAKSFNTRIFGQIGPGSVRIRFCISGNFTLPPPHPIHSEEMASATAGETHAPKTSHTFVRAYQACVACRKRKVKCSMGDPGNPSDPPCQRCRREHKECYFQDLRTKKGRGPEYSDEIHPAKRSRIDASSISPGNTSNQSSILPMNSNIGLFAQAPDPNNHLPISINPTESATADRILHKEVHNAKEALNLLYEAAAESRSESDEGNGLNTRMRFTENEDINTIAWRDFWCVKAGWMTELEARQYVDLCVLDRESQLKVVFSIISTHLLRSYHLHSETTNTLLQRRSTHLQIPY
jgi:hypothetical protein